MCYYNIDYYKILGVTLESTKAEVKQAYRKLALKYHPDINKEAGAEERFKEINIAYEIVYAIAPAVAVVKTEEVAEQKPKVRYRKRVEFARQGEVTDPNPNGFRYNLRRQRS